MNVIAISIKKTLIEIKVIRFDINLSHLSVVDI